MLAVEYKNENRGEGINITIWWTPTTGRFRAAARDFAAFEPTLRHPPIPGINLAG